MTDKIPIIEMIQAAVAARKKAYAPYSNYHVGAAVLTCDGRIYSGCNIENASYGAGVCAERTAIFKAVSEGRHQCKAIVVVGSPVGDMVAQYSYPCGICRQVIREFAVDPDKFTIIVAKTTEDYKVYTLAELLPESFGPENLRV